MAAKPTTAAEKALKKIQDQVTCGICLGPYKQPKLLKCFHMYCEQCLQYLVRGGQRISCPQCHQDTQLPVGGVKGLQGVFYIHYLLDILDTLKKVSSSEQPMCNKCKKREAVRFCRTCGFLCQCCVKTHQEWDNLKSHHLVDLDTLTGDVTTLVPPLKRTLFCSRHQEEAADLYCETCNELICRDCIVRVHRNHEYDLVSESFAKQEKVIVDSVKPVGEQIAMLERAVESVETRCAAVVKQKTAVVAEIHTTMAQLRQALEVRERELVSQAEHTAQQKLKTLKAQREGFELQLGQLRSCQDFVKESQRTCSQGEILMMKNLLEKQVNDLTGSFKPEILVLAEQATMKFAHSLPELMKTCQQFGEVYCHPVFPEKCQASGEGIKKVATRGQKLAVSVKVLDKEGKACLKYVDNFRCELCPSDGSSQVEGTVMRRCQNIYDISYQPKITGEHQLHILIEEQPIMNSPFTVTVLPNFTAPAKVIENLSGPWGVAIREGGEVVVAEFDCPCVSIIGKNGEKKSFGTCRSGAGKLNNPEGVATDSRGNIFVAEYSKNRIQQFSATGKHLKTVTTQEVGPLQFKNPTAITTNPHTCKIYVSNHSGDKIQVLNSDVTYCSAFGQTGSNNGQFKYPRGVSTDRKGNVYVADSGNHRIQVFKANGVYLRQFGREGERKGELNEPFGVVVDSYNLVYVSELSNDRISIFSTDGKFIKSFGREGDGPTQFSGPRGLALDKNGALYVCDKGNNCIKVFF